MGEEQRMILEMVRQRTISPDEAVQLLKALAPFAAEVRPDPAVAGGGKRWRRTEDDRQQDDFRGGDADGRWFSRWGGLGTRLGEVFEAAVEKVRGIDFELGDFQWGHVRTVEEVFTGEMDGKQLAIILPHGTFSVTGWDDPGYRIEIKGFVKEEAEAEALRHLRKNVHFQKGERLVLDLEEQRRYRVEVRACVPRAWLEELTVVANNGSVQVSHLDVDRLIVHSHNGNIGLHQVVGQQLEATAANGKLEMTECRFPHANLLCVNGPMEVAAVIGDATCRTVNGPMHLQLQDATTGQWFLKATNGSIRFELPENVSAEGEFTGAFGKVYNALSGVDVLGEVKEWLNYTYLFRTAGEGTGHVRLTGNCTNGSIYLQHGGAAGRGD